jgi:hypothetical protein
MPHKKMPATLRFMLAARRSELLGLEDLAQVTGEAIAEVDQGMDTSLAGQPRPFGKAGFEGEMMSVDGSAQFTTHQQGIAYLRHRPHPGHPKAQPPAGRIREGKRHG